MRFSLLLALLFGLSASADVYESGVPASAERPYTVDGKIYYRTYEPRGQAVRPIAHCVLIHGFGFTQKTLDMVYGDDLGAKAARVAFGFQLMTPEDAMAKAAWGPALLDGLRNDVCDRVTVFVQESTQTSLLEMTRRTERFVRDKVCNKPAEFEGQKDCALIGHSKGGSVVTQILRRCMEGAQGRTELGRGACLRIAHAYAAAPSSLGTGLAAILLGVHIDGNRNARERFERLINMGIVHEQEALDAFAGDRVDGKTNPSWWDSGPLAPMEDGRAVFWLTQKLVLSKRGWFRGKFAASASAFSYSGEMGQAIGCGSRYKPDRERGRRILRNLFKLSGEPDRLVPPLEFRPTLFESVVEKACVDFDNRVAELHDKDLKPFFDAGVAEMSRRIGADLKPAFTWDRYQVSDGMVEAAQSIAPCRRGDPATVLSCKVFEEKTAVNHLAMHGSALEVAEDILQALKK